MGSYAPVAMGQWCAVPVAKNSVDDVQRVPTHGPTAREWAQLPNEPLVATINQC